MHCNYALFQTLQNLIFAKQLTKDGVIKMSNIRFPQDFPEEIVKRYEKRKWGFTTDGKHQGHIEDIRFFPQVFGKEKFWKGVEKLKFDDDNRVEYRFCYWANLGKGKGWKWGQFCPFYPKNILKDILKEFEKGF